MYHIPVLLNECIEGLDIRPDGIYIDATFGSGGHSRKILEKLSKGKLIAFDLDHDATSNQIVDERFELIGQNFRYIKNFLRQKGILRIEGLLADLGISSWQIDTPDRGFSIRHNGRLDMRMDQMQQPDAADIINTYSRDELIRIFFEYGEIGNARNLADAVLRGRSSGKIETTEHLKQIILPLAPKGKENQYLAKAFQAIRIEVNDELESLKKLISNATDLLNPGGRLVIISYQSLEDRLVKNFFRSGNFEGVMMKDFYGHPIVPLHPVNRKALTPTAAELASNPRSRSAKLRIAQKN